MDVVLHVLYVIFQLGGEHLDDALIAHFVAEFKRKNDVR
jgi:molecular chaperone DnaK (HSP70)